MYTRASSLVEPGGMYASVHSGSTSAGLPVASWPSYPTPFWGHVAPASNDFQTSPWRLPLRLPWYTAPELSTLTVVSPLNESAIAPGSQVLPPENER